MSGAYVLPDGVFPVTSQEGDLDYPFWQGTRLEELRVQRCTVCGDPQWGPEIICHHCHSFDLEFTAVPSRGTIYSWQRSWRAARPEFTDAMPYVAVFVALEAAPQIRMVGNLLGDPRAPVRIGAPVVAVFEHHESYTLVHWRYDDD